MGDPSSRLGEIPEIQQNNFESILRIIDFKCRFGPYSSAEHYNDMDMLQVGRGMNAER